MASTYQPGGPPVHADITTQPGSRLSVPWLQWFNQAFALSSTAAGTDSSAAASTADNKATTALALINALANVAAVENKAGQALDSLSRVANALDYLTQAPPTVRGRVGLYGSFYDTTTQANPGAGVAAVVTFNTTDTALGTYRGTTTSRIYVTDAGVYNVQFSAQIANPDASVDDVNIWFRIDGSDVANSNGLISVPAKHGGFNGHTIAAWNYFVTLSAGQYLELVWMPRTANITLPYIAAGGGAPGTPSVILTLHQANVSIPA